MSKKISPFPSKSNNRHRLRAIKKYAAGDYGIGTHPTAEKGFVEKTVIKEGLEEVFIEDKQ